MTPLTAARRLMRRYAPHARLHVLKRPPEYRGAMWQMPDGSLVLKWSPKSPLTVLLHELGHLRLRHYGGRAYARAAASRAELVLAEVGAWLWAEHAAHHHRLPFSYTLANAYMASYTGKVRIAWRHIKR